VLIHSTRGVRTRSLLDQSFRFSLTLKGLHALLEIILGIAILTVNPQVMNRFALTLLNPELSEDPGDFVATHLLRIFQQFAAGGKHFASLYLLSHGIVKIALIVALFRNKLWAYPTMIVTLNSADSLPCHYPQAQDSAPRKSSHRLGHILRRPLSGFGLFHQI
jgi:uncharacterized membrane protein